MKEKKQKKRMKNNVFGIKPLLFEFNSIFFSSFLQQHLYIFFFFATNIYFNERIKIAIKRKKIKSFLL